MLDDSTSGAAEGSIRIRTPAFLLKDKVTEQRSASAEKASSSEADNAAAPGLPPQTTTGERRMSEATSRNGNALHEYEIAESNGIWDVSAWRWTGIAVADARAKRSAKQRDGANTKTDGSTEGKEMGSNGKGARGSCREDFVLGATLTLEGVTLALALSALFLDAWLIPYVGDDGWSGERIVAGTKWAATHSTKAGFWTVCFNDGVTQLSRNNEFYSRDGGYCSSNIASFYNDEVYSHKYWHHINAARGIGIAFMLTAIFGLILSLSIAATASGHGPKWLTGKALWLQSARCVSTASQVLLGYSLAGLLIWALKGIEGRTEAMEMFGNSAGVSFWLWIAAITTMALRIYMRNAVIVAGALSARSHQPEQQQSTATQSNKTPPPKDVRAKPELMESKS